MLIAMDTYYTMTIWFGKGGVVWFDMDYFPNKDAAELWATWQEGMNNAFSSGAHPTK